MYKFKYLLSREGRDMSKLTKKEVLEIIQRVLNLNGKSTTLESLASDMERWDSLDHLSILVSLDKIFDGKIAGIKEMATADSVSKIINILNDNLLIKK
jgi:acyl carrier protein